MQGGGNGGTGAARADERAAMVEHLRDRAAASDPRVLEVMREVPRHLFVPRAHRADAYKDSPLRIGEGQTISAPHMVAIMLDAAGLRSGQRVLEIGTGSGYHAACTWALVRPDGHVHTMERHGALAEEAKANLAAAEEAGLFGVVDGVTVRVGDGTLGHPDEAPYDRIHVTAAAPDIPDPLKEQLADGGVLLCPVGGRYRQTLMRLSRRGDALREEDLGGCAFVPLKGEHGW